MANTKDLKQRIAEYLSQKQGAGYKEKIEEERQEALAFAEPIADLFNSCEMQELFAYRPGIEIKLFSHNSSSMGAALSGSKPTYEIIVNKEGLCVRRDGNVDEEYALPTSIDTWIKVLPYNGLFHDSSLGGDGDYRFKPNIDDYIQRIERQLERLIQ
ncbi:hypothetical protein CL619_03580 [archaeon]|nr:hypothetical protein [archaeon]|tara:strand:+ start:676 stop:1146 length:471 start_codon:yes stop_codon:yes gene_type:complete